MVGGDGGVVRPKKLVGLVGTVTDSRAYTPPTPRFTKVEAQFFTTVSKYQKFEMGLRRVSLTSSLQI
jgi:hypothetical protein